MSFWDLLKPAPTKSKGAASTPATAEALRIALAEATTAADNAEERAAVLAQARADLLLTGADADLDEADRLLAAAQRTADRGAAATAALKIKLAEAEEAERAAGMDKLFADGQAALDRGLDIYRRYGDAAAELARLVAQLPIASAEIENANKLLVKHGDPRRVPELDTTARRHPPGTVRVPRSPLWERAILPSHDHPYSFLWPVHTHVDVLEPVPQPRKLPPEPQYRPAPGMARG